MGVKRLVDHAVEFCQAVHLLERARLCGRGCWVRHLIGSMFRCYCLVLGCLVRAVQLQATMDLRDILVSRMLTDGPGSRCIFGIPARYLT